MVSGLVEQGVACGLANARNGFCVGLPRKEGVLNSNQSRPQLVDRHGVNRGLRSQRIVFACKPGNITGLIVVEGNNLAEIALRLSISIPPSWRATPPGV